MVHGNMFDLVGIEKFQCLFVVVVGDAGSCFRGLMSANANVLLKQSIWDDVRKGVRRAGVEGCKRRIVI
jgi:hypothetical protein